MNANPLSAVDKVLQVERELNTYILARREEIRGAMLALISRNHVFLLSPPGAGKSFMASEVCRRIRSGVFYKILLTQHTQPEELFGPFDIARLRDEGVLVRQTGGYLPSSHVAQIDEIWKCNAAIINTLLSLSNEREFTNGGRVQRVPLISMFVTSNETPSADQSLEAIYDRILLRYRSNAVTDHESRRKINDFSRRMRAFEQFVREAAARVLLNAPIEVARLRNDGKEEGAKQLEDAMERLAADARPDRTMIDQYGYLLSDQQLINDLMSSDDTELPAVDLAYLDLVVESLVYCAEHKLALPYSGFITPEDLNELHMRSLNVRWPEAVERAFFDLLDRPEHTTSVRREVQLRNLVAAQAVLEDRSEVKLSDLGVLSHALWSNPDEIVSVRAAVDEVSGSIESEVVRLLDSIKEEAAADPYSTADDTAANLARLRQIRHYREELERLSEGEVGNDFVAAALVEASEIEQAFSRRTFGGFSDEDDESDDNEPDDDSTGE